MRSVFADTSYFVALLQPSDEAHEKAVSATSAALNVDIVTTEWVLVEVGNFFFRPELRAHFARLLEWLDGRAEIVPADHEAFERGHLFFAARPDKEWSLTDCISFTVMQDRDVRDALTTDHHFEQAGFNVLLK